MPGPHNQQGDACDRSRYVRRNERRLYGAAPRGHEHIEGAQEIPLRPTPLDKPNLPQTFKAQPSVPMYVTALYDSKRPVSFSRAGPPP